MSKSFVTSKLKPAKTTSELRSVPGFSTDRGSRGHRYEGLSYEDNESENWLKVSSEFCNTAHLYFLVCVHYN